MVYTTEGTLGMDGAKIRPFPYPFIFSPVDPYCGCTFVPAMVPWTKNMQLKFAWKMCLLGHWREVNP